MNLADLTYDERVELDKDEATRQLLIQLEAAEEENEYLYETILNDDPLVTRMRQLLADWLRLEEADATVADHEAVIAATREVLGL